MRPQSLVAIGAIGCILMAGLEAKMDAVRVLLASALLSIGLTPYAKANSITTYTYSGEDFTVFGGTDVGACPPECSLSGSFTVASPLGGGLTNQLITPTSFAFTDASGAVLTNTNTTGLFNEASFLITTNGAGAITAWDINLEAVSVALMESFNGNGSGTPFDESWNAPLTGFNNFAQWQGIEGGPSGSWVSAASAESPEPTTLLLFGTGLVGVGIMRLGRRSNRI